MAPTFKNILAPTDFTEPGNNALKIAIDLCKKHTAVLHLLYVVENRYILTDPIPEADMSALVNKMDQKARNRLYIEYDFIIKTHQIPVQIHMPTGIPFDEICKAATEMPIDLIVMGTYGTSGVRKYCMGTTAYSVIKNTVKPVLTIPLDFNSLEFKKILFPLRPVRSVKKKYEFACSFLNNQDASIHVANLFLQDEEELFFDKKKELYEIRTLLKNTTLCHTNKLYVCDNYAQKVLELSETLAVDLIVINATLNYKWIQFVIHPYTRQITNQSRVPVLSFRDAIDIFDEGKVEKKKKDELNKISINSL